MTVIELLKLAVDNNDISYVKQALSLLVPQEYKNSKVEQSVSNTKPNNNHIVQQNSNIFTSIKQVDTSLKNSPKENKWKDDTTLFADEIGIGVKSPRPRKRSSPLVDVICSICNKQYKVNKILAATYSKDPEQNAFVCDDCLSSKIRK